MPYTKINGANLYYEESGAGPETIVFSHGLLWSGYMFKDQVEEFKKNYHCLTFDFRGQGKSEVTRSGYSIESLYEDTVKVLETLVGKPCHFAGLSMGGFMALRLGIRRPDLVKSLILIDTSARPEPVKNLPKYLALLVIGRYLGLKLVKNPGMKVMFGKKFLNDPQRVDLKKEWEGRFVSNHRIGISNALMGVITRKGVYDQLNAIHTPTLILIGDQDVGTLPDESRRMHTRIRDSQLVFIPGSGHSSSVEEPAFVNHAMKEFLSSLGR